MLLAFATGFNAAHAGRLSAHSLKRAEFSSEQMEGDQQSRVREGYGALIDYFVTQLRRPGMTLLTNLVVRKVSWSRGAVLVEADSPAGKQHFAAHAAIVTLPLGVLKARSVEFEPALLDKEEAIAGLEFGNVTRVSFLFDTVWWRDHDFGFVHSLEDPIPTWWSDPRAPLIVGWAGGEKADLLRHRSEADLRGIGIGIMAKLFEKPEAEVRERLIMMRTHNWAADPYARGAYSYIPVNGLFMPKLLGAPIEETLFFAGEATAIDAQLGTVFAALESGYRAAREVNASSLVANEV
jgi:monoamine oxidase